MADNKISLENILDEYSPDTEQTDAPHVERVDAQKVISYAGSMMKDPRTNTSPRLFPARGQALRAATVSRTLRPRLPSTPTPRTTALRRRTALR